MASFDLDSVDHVLRTTRSVRKRLDFSRPVPRPILEECLEIALQAPTGGNRQEWQFVFVEDAEKRRALADLYREVFAGYVQQPRAHYDEGDPRAAALPRVMDSASYLAEHFDKAPVFFIPCFEGRIEKESAARQASTYGSILPAVWSFMLAARARGIGAAWTTLHLFKEREAAEILGIPETVTQAALLPLAYFSGDDFQPAPRVPGRELTHWDHW
ncbi:MAG: nitroreductase family protein [Myxococcales bacterium]|nr:nitroreductase family protein [Myxococcales bacterium]